MARRPLALRQNGGTEKHIDADLLQQQGDKKEDGSDDDDEDAYASDNDDNEESMNATDSNAEAGPSNSQPPMDKTSKDIPKGFARIIRDAQGNVIDVVMSAYDEPDEPSEEQEELENSHDMQDEEEETPWGKPLAHKEHEKKLRKAAEPVPARSAALRGEFSHYSYFSFSLHGKQHILISHFVNVELEERTAAERSIKASSLRYASSAEQEYLRSLVQKHGSDIQAMAKDFKLNQDQRTAGQLKKAFARCGGVEAFLA